MSQVDVRECECGHGRGLHTGKATACMYFPANSDVCPCAEYVPFRPARMSTPPSTPPPSGATTGAPWYGDMEYARSNAQWARAQALRCASRIIAGSRTVISQDEARRMESVIDTWAHYIETGRWSAEQ